MIMYYMLPIFSYVIGGILAFFIILFALLAILGTIFLIFAYEPFRTWFTSDMMSVPNFFFHIGENITKVGFVMPYIEYGVLGLSALVFILSFVYKKKKKKNINTIPFIIFASIYFVIAGGFLFYYLITGNPTLI